MDHTAGLNGRSLKNIDSEPTAAEIRSAVDRIVASPGFRYSPQLVSFLRYVVESTLTGKAHALKSYSIGIEALGRREDFDPHVDPIVRVEAGRLRRALARYYAGDGAGRPIIIEIPLGHYVPIFNYRKYPYLAVRLAAILSQRYVKLIDAWTRPRQDQRAARVERPAGSNAS